MKLIDAHKLLVSLTKSPDNARYFKETYEHFGKQGDDDLHTYLEFVCENCVEWLERLPDKLTSQESLAKPKSAIIKLLDQQTVVDELGTEFCNTAKSTLVTTWKSHKDAIVADRTAQEESFTQSVSTGSLDEELETNTSNSLVQHKPESFSTEESNPQEAIRQLKLENLKLVEQLTKCQEKMQVYKEACFNIIEICYPDKKELWSLMKSVFIE
jgi:hypothetical protein